MINLQEVALRVKFIGKISSFGKDRYVLVFPKEQSENGKHMKGKFFKVSFEEVTLENEDNNDHKKKKELK